MEENRKDDKDMMISDEVPAEESAVREMMSAESSVEREMMSDSASAVFMGYGDGTAKPKKSRKGIWIGLLLIVVVLGAISPFAMAMIKKSGLRKNPNLYVLDSLNRTDYTKSFAYEMSVKLGDGFKGLIDESAEYAPVEIKADDVISFIEGFRLKFTTSDINYKATGENPMFTVKYDFLFNDKDVFDSMFSVGEKGLQLDVVGKKFLFLADLKLQSYEEQQNLVEALKKDKEVQDILAKFFSKTELAETDIVDSKTGQKCDLLKVQISLKDLYEMLKSFVNIMDTNEAVMSFVNGSLDRAIEMQASNGEYDKTQIEFVKKFVKSGVAVSILKEIIKENDADIIEEINKYGVYLSGNLYVNADGVVRSDLDLAVGGINTMFVDIPGFSIHFDSYRASLINEVKMSENTADLVFKEPYTDLRYEVEDILETLRADIVNKIVASPGFTEIRAFLSKFMDVDEMIKSMKMN